MLFFLQILALIPMLVDGSAKLESLKYANFIETGCSLLPLTHEFHY